MSTAVLSSSRKTSSTDQEAGNGSGQESVVMDCRCAIRRAGILSLPLGRLFQAELTPAARSRSSLVTQSCQLLSWSQPGPEGGALAGEGSTPRQSPNRARYAQLYGRFRNRASNSRVGRLFKLKGWATATRIRSRGPNSLDSNIRVLCSHIHRPASALSEGKAVINEGKYPFIVEVAVAANGLDVELNNQIVGFHKSRRLLPKFGRMVFRDGQTYYRWCFSDLTTARAFVEQFGGVFYKTTGT
jgi:hypothetical protein